MTRYVDKLAILAKIETAYGTDAAPTGAANAIQVSNVTFTPLAGDQDPNDVIAPYMGHQGVDLTGNYRQLEFDVELGGAGTAGDAPAYGPLLRGCGFGEGLTVGESAVYMPVSSGFESLSIYYQLDGGLWAMLGTRGKFTVDMTAQKKPRLHFTYSGLLGQTSDTALPVADYSAFIRPPVVNKANTTFTFGGVTPPMGAFSIDGGQSIQPRMIVNYEAIEHADRQMTGSVTLDQVPKATKDWEAVAIPGTRQVLQLVHGTDAGNIIQIDAPSVQVGRFTQGNDNKIATNTLPLMFTPSSGNDELTITIK